MCSVERCVQNENFPKHDWDENGTPDQGQCRLAVCCQWRIFQTRDDRLPIRSGTIKEAQ